MRAQNMHMRARRVHSQPTKTNHKTTEKEETTLGEQLLNYCVTVSVLGMIAIFIFYSIRYAYGTSFSAQSALPQEKREVSLYDEEDYKRDEFRPWTQPAISMDAIPKNIYTISNSDEQECGDLNPDWDFHTFTKAEALEIVKKEYNIPDDVLSNFQHPYDLFKYHIINKYGGLYIETKAKCTGDLDQWIEYYYPQKHVHFNNYYLNNENEGEDAVVELDMVIAFESAMPYAFSGWVFFTKPSNPILQYIIDSYLQSIGIDRGLDDNHEDGLEKELFVGPKIFTEAIVGFANAFTMDGNQALGFHGFEDDKAHMVSLYLNENIDLTDLQSKIEKEDMMNILVVPMPDMRSIVRRRRPHLRRTQPVH